MEILNNIIPTSSPVFKKLEEIAETSKIVIFSGLPGVGKSLYVHEFKLIAKSMDRTVDVIQWDVARKAFETPFISEHFPMGEGTVHNGLKIMAGQWLMDEIDLWVEAHADSDNVLLIEAPLVGHRFIEIAKKNYSPELEQILSADTCKVVVPIPSKIVREKIEAERKRQVSEEAKVWSGAKPSVMLMLWKMTCEIANEFGMDIDVSGQPPYNPDVYKYVYGEILKHRHFEPLVIDEVFEVPEQDESALHDDDSYKADGDTANHYATMIKEGMTDASIDDLVSKWYLT